MQRMNVTYSVSFWWIVGLNYSRDEVQESSFGFWVAASANRTSF